MVIRNVKIKKREGAVVNIKSFLKESRITVGDWIILKVKNLITNKEFIFTANVRDDYRINLRKSIRSNLGLKFNEKTPIELEVVEQLKKIKLRNKGLYNLSNSLTDVLPNSVKINGATVNLNCYEHQNNKIIFSYKNSKSSNYILIDRAFTFDPFIVGLWRAEGGKYALIGSSFQFTNSNLRVVRAWILFLLSLGFSSKDLRLSYYIQYISPKRDLIREKILINYWSKSLNIPKSRFGWIYKEGLGYKSKYYGSLQIKFNNSTLSFIMQYLFLKFESSFLLRFKNRDIAINYIKGALCDCNCYIRTDTIKEIRFSTSGIGEAELYSKILFRHFHIFSKIVPDGRNKCFYLIIAGWKNLSYFLIYRLYNSISWKGTNFNYDRFRTGMSNHLCSKIVLALDNREMSIDELVCNLSNKDLPYNYSMATLIRRAISYLVHNNFLVTVNQKIYLSRLGMQVFNTLNTLSALSPGT